MTPTPETIGVVLICLAAAIVFIAIGAAFGYAHLDTKIEDLRNDWLAGNRSDDAVYDRLLERVVEIENEHRSRIRPLRPPVPLVRKKEPGGEGGGSVA